MRAIHGHEPGARSGRAPEPWKAMISAINEALRSSTTAGEGVIKVVEVIRASNPLYHWTGVYLLEGSALVLAHQIGRPTPHARISLDQGICGAAAREKATVVVDDVNADPRYLACNLQTRSEIVVPLLGIRSEVLGEIDVDSDEPAAFTDEDRLALEGAAKLLARFLEASAKSPPRHAPPPASNRRAGEHP